uniref:Uncharacterized protein n=1 Tax=Avena sativa TaxID=4498 RepID=A0ACD5TVH4_AVESA
MGVHGLWGLLAPVGRRVSVETLAGKRLAVDASIWMVQFMRAMRDDKGDMIRDAHILGFLRRICKLLFLRARPVFVFDGATPALKRRTLAARRRHRDAAQAKVRKTAEKLLISHLKASRLEELAAQIKSDRAKHDAKGKQVESSRREETEITNGDQNQNDDGENSRGTTAPINQEKLDELLAASLAAEDEADLTGRVEHNSASVTLQEGTGIDEDENDDDVEMIFPMTTGELDPAVLASLPPSMQLDLLVQINDGQTGTNRAYSLGSLPLHNLSTSTPAARPSPSSKDNDTIISAPKTHEWPKDDSVEVVKQNTSNSDKSECNTNDPYIGETSKAPQKELLMDELVAKTAIQKENVIQEDINITTSEMNSTEPSENYDSHIISENNLEEELSFLRREQVDLGNERRKLESHAESVSSEMFAECQELLQMFGLPYIIAPMEAEAQCAYMEINNLVDGVVTDDSDVFLFGARNVYKNIFDERKYVETYLMKDIESELGLTREQLIRMALLLGSDYTEGISGIGIVNAIEVVNAFPEEDGLQKFREWIESPDPAILGLGKLDMEASGSSKRRKPGGNEPCEKGNSQQPECVEGPDDNLSSYEKQHVKEVFMSKHRNVSKNWHIPSTFPSETVISAYISPQVDDSTERFSWGRPDLSLLRKLCWERFGWNKEKADELLLPVLKEYNKHETQLRMEAFYSFNERFAKIRSKRVQKAIKGITGKTFSETDELQEDSPSTSSAPKKKEAGPSKPRGKRNTSAGPRHIGSREDDKIGDPNSFADADELAKEHRSASKKKSAIPFGRSRGRGRKGMNVGQETTRNQEDSEVKGSTMSLDEGSHKRHASKSEGMEVRRSNRKRKEVTYMEDDHEADDNDVPLHQVDDNDPSQTATDSDMTGQDTEFNLLHRDTSELNSDQMHEDPGNAENMDEDPLGQTESAPKEYLFTGGGFCMEEDEQDTAVDQSGGDGTSDACEDMGGVSEGRKSIGSSTTIEEFTENASKEARGASSLKRRKANRGLQTPTKRNRK